MNTKPGAVCSLQLQIRCIAAQKRHNQFFIEVTYDALGRLKTKYLGTNAATGIHLESISYDYNIRGWLLGANRPFVKVNAANTNWFGFDLGYNKTSNSYGSITVGGLPQYNGNISTSAWRSRGNCDLFQYYNCRYDAANRLEAAYYKVVTSISPLLVSLRPLWCCPKCKNSSQPAAARSF